MPIRPELRQFYGREWREVTRPRILARAGNRCESCGVPNHTRATRAMGWWMIAPERWWFTPWRPDQFPEILWRNVGTAIHKGDNFPREICHEVYIVITVAHLNHISGDDRDENLKALCQYHHLAMDVFQHKATRATRKDAARPLLVGA
jgi:hypothetical protein